MVETVKAKETGSDEVTLFNNESIVQANDSKQEVVTTHIEKLDDEIHVTHIYNIATEEPIVIHTVLK